MYRYALTTTTDWNTATTPGDYYGAGAATNSPASGKGFFGMVFSNGPSVITQMVWRATTGVTTDTVEQYQRNGSSGSWSPWMQILPKPNVASGEVTCVITSAIAANVSLTFPAGRFVAAPNLMVACRTTSVYIPYVNSVSTTGASVGARHYKDLSQSINVPIAWYASDPW